MKKRVGFVSNSSSSSFIVSSKQLISTIKNKDYVIPLNVDGLNEYDGNSLHIDGECIVPVNISPVSLTLDEYTSMVEDNNYMSEDEKQKVIDELNRMFIHPEYVYIIETQDCDNEPPILFNVELMQKIEYQSYMCVNEWMEF